MDFSGLSLRPATPYIALNSAARNTGSFNDYQD
jgi:hypothetical protein